MCTVTWRRRPDGYDLLFNRDELLSRAEADPPAEFERDGVRWLAPTDRDAGGTWIAVNECGLTFGLLNGIHVPLEPRDYTTRGRIVAELARNRALAGVRAALDRFDPDPYRPFRLLVVAPDRPALVAEWDRASFRVDVSAEHRRPLVSSSFDESAVGVARRAEYERVTGHPATSPPGRSAAEPGLAELLAFHRSTHGGPSAYTVSMERPDAATRSFTRIHVKRDDAYMIYSSGPPARPGPESRLRLARSPLCSPSWSEEGP